MKYPNLTRLAVACVALAMLVAPAIAQQAMTIEPDWDRPGGDYENFELAPHLGLTYCMNRCAGDPRCKAYTYVRSPGGGRPGRCYLKTYVPGVNPNGCCVSGYRLLNGNGALSTGNPEWYYDRPGYDYHSFEMQTTEPYDCRLACARDARCRSYTYVFPGVQGAKPRCYLKSAVAPPVANKCCISGVNPWAE